MNEMYSKALATLCTLLVAVQVQAQITGPTEVTVQPGRLATVTVVVDADEAEYEVLSTEFDAFREYTTSLTRLTIKVSAPPNAKPGASGYVVVSAVKSGKLIRPIYKCMVIVAGKPAPPEPIPDPVPPTPAPNTIAKKLKEAAVADGMQPIRLLDIADATKVGAMMFRAGQTAGRTKELLKEALKGSPPLGKNLAKIIDEITTTPLEYELKDSDFVLTEAVASKWNGVFTKLAKDLTEAAK